MPDRVLVRVVCRERGEGMGRMVKTETGAQYQVHGPDLHSVIPPATLSEQRIPGAFESVNIDIEDVAETYGDRVPACCSSCRGWRWVQVERLRGGKATIANKVAGSAKRTFGKATKNRRAFRRKVRSEGRGAEPDASNDETDGRRSCPTIRNS